MTASTWNSGDLSGITLSNNSLTATATAVGAARATQGQTTGKYYFELICNNSTGANTALGIANASAALATVAATPTNAALIYPSGNLYVNNVSQGNKLGTLPYSGIAGYNIGFAVDLGAKLIWVRYCALGSAAAGNWNNSGTADPASGAGGVSISSITASAIFPVFGSNASGDIATGNFGVTPFVGTVPSGFTAGWPTNTTQTTSYTIWNGSDQSGTTLLGGSLEATWPQAAGGVRSVIGSALGKYYFEVARVSWANGGTCAGIANLSANLATVAAAPTNAAVIYNSGTIYVNNIAQATITGGVPRGAVVGIAFDLVNAMVWFRIAPSGNWNNSGTANPATNTGGFSISAIAGGAIYALAATSGTTFGGDSVAADFGDSPFVGVVPSGFTAGLPKSIVYDDFAGNIGGVSLYGKGLYGAALYSQGGAFAPIFAANLIVVATDDFAGNLAPVISFAGNLSVGQGLGGDLAPVVVFGADLNVIGFVDLAGDIAPQIALGGSLSLVVSLTVLEGGLTANVALGASNLISGPLWASSAPCPPPLWTETEPCPPPMWVETAPCGPVGWEDSELCNG